MPAKPRRHLRQDAFLARAQYHHAVANPVLKPAQQINFRADVPQKWQPDEGRLAQLGGPLITGFHPVVPDNGYNNFLAAFRKRCNYFSAERATPRIIDGAHEFVDHIQPECLPQFEWSQLLYDDWKSNFGEEKQKRMDSAVSAFSNAHLKDYSRKDVFVKVEALLVEHKPNWAPRVIYKGTDIYNALSGPIFNELMRRFNLALKGMKGKWQFTVAYRSQPHEFVPKLSEVGGDFIESDFSANDMRQCSDVYLLEMMLMRRLGCPEWFVRLHSKTNHFRVDSRNHGVSAHLENQLPTGATDTTFRNTFWNATILWCFLVSNQAGEARALLLGDDMLARVTGLKQYAAKTYQSIAAEARMVATTARFRGLVDCSFLSKSFVPCYGRHLTIPLLGKALGRFNTRANANQSISDAQYFAGKAVSYAYEFRYFPHLRDLFLLRFQLEWPIAKQEGRLNEELVLGRGALEAGVTLKSIRDKLFVELERPLIGHPEFNAFCVHRYGFTFWEVVDLFETALLHPEDPDLSGPVVEALAKDFV